MADKFWLKWNIEYLTELRESHNIKLRQARSSKRKIPEIGEIVIIQHDLLPRGSWQLGRIVEVIESADNLIRSAKVITKKGKITHRPISKLIPLEIRSVSFNDTHQTQETSENQINKPTRSQPARRAKR
uniref:DUF5641 domain-containing protein n=1 Tax=Heterorhabditis bacteriophora TaxID=37862 RepID=A0A1I7XIY5_HETBA